jgi:chromosomal replication initiation ATPase DnaA
MDQLLHNRRGLRRSRDFGGNARRDLKRQTTKQEVNLPQPLSTVVEISDEQEAMSLIRVVAAHFNLSIKDILSRSRVRPLVIPRQVAMAVVRGHTNLSSTFIGKVFKRDHTTVLHGITTAENYYSHHIASIEKVL